MKKAQLSAEMILLVVIIIAIIAIVASNLFSTAKKTSDVFERKVENLTKNVESMCITDLDCNEGERCVDGICKNQ
jgi:FtsZ-interacting cell division protein ZipA